MAVNPESDIDIDFERIEKADKLNAACERHMEEDAADFMPTLREAEFSLARLTIEMKQPVDETSDEDRRNAVADFLAARDKALREAESNPDYKRLMKYRINDFKLDADQEAFIAKWRPE